MTELAVFILLFACGFISASIACKLFTGRWWFTWP